MKRREFIAAAAGAVSVVVPELPKVQTYESLKAEMEADGWRVEKFDDFNPPRFMLAVGRDDPPMQCFGNYTHWELKAEGRTLLDVLVQAKKGAERVVAEYDEIKAKLAGGPIFVDEVALKRRGAV